MITKKLIAYGLLLFVFQLNASESKPKKEPNGMGVNAGYNVGKASVDRMAESAMVLTPVVASAITNAGYGFGVGALKTIGSGAVAVKTGIVATAVASAPYVAVGCGIYGSYRLFRYFRPSSQQVAKEEKLKAEASQSRVATEQSKLEEKKVRSEIEFKDCLSNNSCSTLNNRGFPTVCEKSAMTFSVLFGNKKADKTIKDFSKMFSSFKGNGLSAAKK